MVASLKTMLASAKAKATDNKDQWEQFDQSQLVQFCRHALRSKPELKETPFPGRSAGRGVLREWLRSHFCESML